MAQISNPIGPATAQPLFSGRAMTIFGIAAAVTFSASSSAPTPLYRLYQQGLGLSPLLITTIFAVYAFSLLGALLTVGSLSDYIGRKPVIFAALALNAVAMALFATADSATGLIVARAVQGFATGAATTTLGATILDTDRARGPVYNSVTAFLGLMLGALGSGALVSFAPHPTQLIYVVLLMLTGLEIAVLTFMPETSTGKPGALAALRPQMNVPSQIRVPLLQAIPVNIAAWALGGLYLLLMPSLVRAATGLTLPLVGSVAVSTLMLSGAVSVLALREMAAARVLSIAIAALIAGVAITLAGVWEQTVVLMLLGAAVAGIGFGAAFSGNLRTILPLAKTHERAGLLSAFYVISYLSFSLPAIAAGLAVPELGLPMTATLYGAVVMTLALVSWAARSLTIRPRQARVPTQRVTECTAS
jgi:MFS family permease